MPHASPPEKSTDNPLLQGEFAEEVVYALRMTLRTLLVILPVMFFALLMAPGVSLEQALAMGALFPLVLGLMLLLRAGRIQWVFSGLVIMLIAFGIVSVLQYGSIRSSGALSFVGAIVLGGIFMPPRGLLAALLACVAALGVLVFAEQSGWLPAPNYTVTGLHWLVHSIVLGSIALNIYYARRLVVRALARMEEQYQERRRAETALGESEDSFRLLFRNSPAALIITRLADGAVVDLNEAYERMFLITRAEAAGHTTAELDLWGLAETRDLYIADVLRDRRIVDRRVSLRRRNGVHFDAIMSTEYLEWKGGPHLFSTITDVSAESTARNALRASEQRLNAIFRHGPTPIFVTNFEQRAVVEMNAAAERLFGVAGDRVVGLPTGTLMVDPAQMADIREQLATQGKLTATPVRMRNLESGRIVQVLVSAAMIEEAGVRYTINTAVDISAEVEARDALKASEERFSKAFQFSPIGMTITRLADGKIIEVNDADERVLGYTRAETLGRTTLENGAWSSPAERQRFVDELNRTGRVLGLERQMRTKAGERMEARVFAERIELNGEPCILAATLNITEEKRHALEIEALNQSLERRVGERTAQLKTANAELEAFSYSVSHDLRSPLRAIGGFTQLLSADLKGRLTPDEEAMLERIVDGGRRMNQLIDDMLNLSKLGRAEFARATTDVNALATEIARRLAERDPARQVHWDIAPALVAECDAGLLRILLENLLGNAWKFTGKAASACIRVGTEAMPEGGTCWFVADDGAGFDMQYADRMFTPFQRMHTNDQFEGTGIGLAIVHRIVMRHGGRIWATAAPGQGATFRFTLRPD